MVAHGADLVEHLANTLGGGAGDDDHDEDHRDHHHAHEDLQRVGDQCGHVAGGQAEVRVVAGGHDLLGADPGDNNQGRVDAQVHGRRVEAQDLLGAHEVVVDRFGDAAELAVLMLLAVERLDHADALQVLVHDVVQLVVGVEHAFEDRVHVGGQADEHHGQDRDDHEEHQRDLLADAEREDPGDDHHHRRAHGGADDHHVGVLQVGDVRGQARDDRTGGEPVDVGEAEALHLCEQVVAQVLGEARGADGRVLSGQEAARQRDERAQQQDQAELEDGGHVAAGDALVDQCGHNRRDDDFQKAFDQHERRGQQTGFLVFAQASAQRPDDMLRTFLRLVHGRL